MGSKSNDPELVARREERRRVEEKLRAAEQKDKDAALGMVVRELLTYKLYPFEFIGRIKLYVKDEDPSVVGNPEA